MSFNSISVGSICPLHSTHPINVGHMRAPAPTTDADVATKKYVDDNISGVTYTWAAPIVEAPVGTVGVRDATNALSGAVTAAAQSFAGAKTFEGGVKFLTASVDMPAPVPALLNYYEVLDFESEVSEVSSVGATLVGGPWHFRFTRLGGTVTFSSTDLMHRRPRRSRTSRRST
jgi:hypothetical protein